MQCSLFVCSHRLTILIAFRLFVAVAVTDKDLSSERAKQPTTNKSNPLSIQTYLFKLSLHSSIRLPILSQHIPQPSDEPYEIYERYTRPTSRRQPASSQRILQQPRPSASPESLRTLRRTPRLQELRSRQSQSPIAAATRQQSTTQRLAEPTVQPGQSQSEEGDNSTTPRPTRQSSRTLLSYWPSRSTHISRRTASAILYALEEAIRTPFLFTPDLLEENASMSDLAGGGPVPASVTNGRAQNGSTRAVSGPAPVPQYSSSGVRTPTDIWRQRLDREAKKKAERERDEEEKRRAQEESDKRPTAGLASSGASGRDRGYQRARDAPTTRRPAGDGPVPASTTDRRPADRESSGTKANPTAAAPQTYVPRGIATDASATPGASSTKPRGPSISQGQPRTVQQKPAPRAASAPYSTQQQPSQTRNSSAAVNSQAQAEPSTSVAGGNRPRASREQAEGAQTRTNNTSSFPHAFERWETLSSHWEGLTSYWIRRLDQNSDEMSREPLNQQMARQVTDLSAAGANLFHAVVELQRLRASSERKFQRWFFDTRAEQERAQEIQGGLENSLRMERQARADAIADVSRLETEKNTAYQMKATAEQMVKEMRRELQISKEEARRAWEELGRREQEERDRTISLRSGEPTLVGGVQVVPMMQGAPNPQGATNISSVQSTQEAVENDEPGYTTYDPARSETDTDPFTEGGRGNPAQPPYQQSFASPIPTPNSQPEQQASNTSSAAAQAARVALSSSLQQQTSAPSQATSTSAPSESTYLRYGPNVPVSQPSTTTFYQHQSPILHEGERHARTSEADERSYVPSVDTLSEEDYELNDNGEISRDAQGRPVLRGGLGSEDSDEYDVQDQQERERLNRQRYGSGITGVEYGSGPTNPPSNRPQTSGRNDGPYTGAPGPSGQAATVDYTGSGYGSGLGWEAIPRHHHPTRLSDVIEEDERSRTSPSRASQTSRVLR